MDGAFVEAIGIRVSFGGVVALANADLRVAKGEIRGLIGPNGAGKSTLVNVIAGARTPDEGTIRIASQPVDRIGPRGRAKQGVMRTYQAPAVFGSLTVRENLDLAARFRRRHGRNLSDEQAAWLNDLIVTVGLEPWLDTIVRHAPYQVHKIVDTLRAVYTAPSVLLVDEPAAGLPPDDRDRLVHLLNEARDMLGIGVVIIEHDMQLVFEVCDTLTVLNFGEVIAEGKAADVRVNPAVRSAYLGAEQ